FVIGDQPLAEYSTAHAFDQRLGEVECEAGVLDYRLLDAFDLLFDVRKALSNRISRAVHHKGGGKDFGHQTALLMNRSVSFTRSSPEVSLGSSVSRKAASVLVASALKRSLANHGSTAFANARHTPSPANRKGKRFMRPCESLG